MDPGSRSRSIRSEGLVTGRGVRVRGGPWRFRRAHGPDTEAAAAPLPNDREAAFRNLYARTAPALRGYLRMLSRDASLADDLLQDTFVRFLRADTAGLDEARAKRYLYKTAASVFTDHYRAQTRDQRTREEALRRVSSPSPDPDLSHDVSRVFAELDVKQQTLLWLAYVEGFDHREMAHVLDMREKSIRVVLHRARRRLADMLHRVGLAPGGLR